VRWWREHPETLVYEGLRKIEIPAANGIADAAILDHDTSRIRPVPT
jgi:hypothetical protein